jgi:hypothetical protein
MPHLSNEKLPIMKRQAGTRHQIWKNGLLNDKFLSKGNTSRSQVSKGRQILRGVQGSERERN